MGKTVLVTGGAGFIGTNLVARLLATEGIDQVRVLDDRSAGDHGTLADLTGEPTHPVGNLTDPVGNLTDPVGNLTDSRGSILDPSALAEATDGVDAIVHLAARASVPESVANPVDSHAVNVTGTVRVLEAARQAGNAQVIVASSAALYGADPTLPTPETTPPDPRSPYAATKLATEASTMAWSATYDLPVLPLRFFNVYGPYQPPGHVYAAAIPAFAAAVVEGTPVTVFGDGSQTRDFVYVDDVAWLITRAITHGLTSPVPVNVAAGTRTSLLEIIDRLGQAAGTTVATEFGPPRAGDVQRSQADISRLQALVPSWSPTPLADGLAATLDWMRVHLRGR
ncbi:NAD-dependent epimerase/dehydratase family protein [Euzebya tangerina]|uniref:NAD-dependent epimerase/dehydratase family protein n=1 Tax=Euzebya tangerina TaxID=591198 RepID=UPI00196A5241|nr:NAD-dependent epimerase/dehydratase family protein [Euzebya tangerina]